MSGHMKKPLIKRDKVIIILHHNDATYRIPQQIAEKYRIEDDSAVNADDVFSSVNRKYTKPGALLRGIRIREGLTQVELALKIHVTQSDISQMENGVRHIGSKVAKRIGKIFGINYRVFLE